MPVAFEKLANDIFSPVDAGGSPRRVSNSDAQIWGSTVERLLSATSAAGTWYATRALMNADLAHDAGTLGIVYADPNPALNGMYVKQGASGSGSWTQISNQLPTGAAVVAVTVTGGGPNALTATFNPNTQFSPGQAIYILRGIAADNTGPITINGKPYRTNLGSDFAAGGIKAGGIYLFVDNGSEYRTLTDQDISALVTQAEDAADRAEAAADAAAGAIPNSFPPTRADMATQATTVVNSYLIEPGFEGFFHLIDITSGAYDDLIAADTVGGEIVISDTNPDLAYLRQRKYGDHVKLSEQGGDFIRALAVAHERANLFGPDAKVVLENNVPGSSELTSGFRVPANVELVDQGKGKNVLVPDGLADTQLISPTGTIGTSAGRYVAFAGPAQSERYTASLGEFDPIVPGQPWVDFHSEPTTLSVGMGLMVQKYADYSFGAFTGRPYYKMGHRAIITGIQQVSGKWRVWISLPFRDAYTYSTTSGSEILAHGQYLVKNRLGLSLDLSELSLRDTRGLFLNSYAEVDFHDLDVRNAGYSALDYQDLISCNLYSPWGGTVVRSPYPGSEGPGNDYGHTVNNSTDVKIYSPRGDANWHIISLGGGAGIGCIQNYRVVVYDADWTTSGSGTPHSASHHGNADDCGWIGCRFGSGMSLNGRDPFAIDCKVIHHPSATETTRLLSMSEVYGGKIRVINCEFHSDRTTGSGSSGGHIHGLAVQGTVTEPEFIFDRVLLNLPNSVQPIRLEAAAPTPETASPVGFSFYFDGEVNVPASSFGVARLINWESPAGKYCIMKRATGLTAGKPYVAHTTYTANYTEFPEQRGVLEHTAAAAASSTPGAFNFDHAYPTFHTITPAVTGDVAAGLKATAKIFSVSNSNMRLTLATGDGTNLTAADTKMYWNVR